MQCHRRTAIAHFNSRRRIQPELCESLNKMRHEGRYCDLELIAHGQIMPVHKNILAASSAYFDTMFSSSFIEHDSRTVDLSDVFPSPEILQDILNYIYTGKISLNEERFRDILNGASHFLLEELRESCSHYMFVNLSPLNVLELWTLAEMYSLTPLARLCQEIVRARFHDVLMHMDEITHIPLSCLSEIIDRNCMEFVNTQDRIKFLIKWVSLEPEERSKPLRLVLQDPHIRRKLGLLDELPLMNDNEFSMCDYLDSLLDDTRYVLPALAEMNEALVGWNYKVSKTDEDTRILTLCAYVPFRNLWYTLTKFRVNRFFGYIIGFIGKRVLFKSLHGFVMVNLLDLTFERIALPRLQRTSGVRSHSIFVFEGKVFCIMEYSQYVKRNLPNGSHFMFPEAKTFVKVYDFEREQWQKVCDLPVPKQIAWLPLQYQVIPREDYSTCYILAMSSTSNFQIRGPHDQWRINGPYLLAVKKRRTKYAVLRMTDPPIDRTNMLVSDLYKNLRFTGKGNKLYLHGATVKERQGTEQCEGRLEYNIDSGMWSRKEACTISFPHRDNANVQGLDTASFHLGSVAVGGVQSHQFGHTYHLNVPCPYVSRFCSADIVTGEVRQLTPPPSETLHEFSVCRIPADILNEASCLYSQQLDKKCKNRMARGHIVGHDRQWTCVFQAKPKSKLSISGSSSNESSPDTSEQDIDVIN